MSKRNFYEKKRFQSFFFKSTVVAIAISILTLLFQISPANLILFSALGASAVLLVNKKGFSNTTLRVVFESYIITSIIALIVLYSFNFLGFEKLFAAKVFITMFLSSLALYLTKSLHPPAIGSGLAFLIFERSILELGVLLIAILVLLFIVRLMMYVYYEHHKIEHFFQEFIKNENHQMEED